MRTILKSSERGHTKISWLDSKHSFSFGEYYNPEEMHFSDLRVINEDIIAPGQGFDMHPHRNMEIVTFVLGGSLLHKDSLGSAQVLTPGIIQKMSAGKGILHSEYNNSATDPLHLMQIWITPDRTGTLPSYEESPFQYIDDVAYLASPQGQGGQVTLQQDAHIYAIRVDSQRIIKKDLYPTRKYWIQVVRGVVEVDGTILQQGDAMRIQEETSCEFASINSAELLFFDLRG